MKILLISLLSICSLLSGFEDYNNDYYDNNYNKQFIADTKNCFNSLKIESLNSEISEKLSNIYNLDIKVDVSNFINNLKSNVCKIAKNMNNINLDSIKEAIMGIEVVCDTEGLSSKQMKVASNKLQNELEDNDIPFDIVQKINTIVENSRKQLYAVSFIKFSVFIFLGIILLRLSIVIGLYIISLATFAIVYATACTTLIIRTYPIAVGIPFSVLIAYYLLKNK